MLTCSFSLWRTRPLRAGVGDEFEVDVASARLVGVEAQRVELVDEGLQARLGDGRAGGLLGLVRLVDDGVEVALTRHEVERHVGPVGQGLDRRRDDRHLEAVGDAGGHRALLLPELVAALVLALHEHAHEHVHEILGRHDRLPF